MIQLLFILLTFSCTLFNPKIENLDIAYHENGNIKYKIQKTNNIHNGKAMYWDEIGNLINEVEYLNGVFHGDWKEYFSNGKLKYIISYENGLKNGYECWYYENGQKKSETLYKKGTILNKTIRWNANGELIFK